MRVLPIWGCFVCVLGCYYIKTCYSVSHNKTQQLVQITTWCSRKSCNVLIYWRFLSILDRALATYKCSSEPPTVCGRKRVTVTVIHSPWWEIISRHGRPRHLNRHNLQRRLFPSWETIPPGTHAFSYTLSGAPRNSTVYARSDWTYNSHKGSTVYSMTERPSVAACQHYQGCSESLG